MKQIEIVSVTSLESMKAAIASKKDLIVIEGSSAVTESVDYLQTIKVVGRIGTLGIVAGIFFLTPLIFVGIGEKIVTHSAKSYTFIVNNDFSYCLLIRKAFVNELFSNVPQMINNMKKACGLSNSDISKETHLSVAQVKSVLNGDFEKIRSEEGTIVLDYIEKQYLASAAIITDKDMETYEYLKSLLESLEKYGFTDDPSTPKKHPNVGKGFLKIHKTHDAIYEDRLGRLVWDWGLYNEITFEDYTTAEKISLFKGDLLSSVNPLKKSEDAEEKFDELVKKYGITK